MSSQKWGDLIPHVKFDEQAGLEAWFIGDDRIGLFGASTMVFAPDGTRYPTRWPKSYPEFPRESEIHPSSWDVHERLAIMDVHGVRGVHAVRKSRRVEELLRRHRRRGLPARHRPYVQRLPDRVGEPGPGTVHSPGERSVLGPRGGSGETARRTAKLGHKGIVTTGIPERHGLPPFADHTRGTCSGKRVPSTTCRSTSTRAVVTSVRSSIPPRSSRNMGAGGMMAAATTNIILDTAASLSDLLHSAVLPRFPDTRWVIVESAVGYIPFVLECADEHLARLQAKESAVYEAVPSEYFRRQVYTTFWFEKLEPTSPAAGRCAQHPVRDRLPAPGLPRRPPDPRGPRTVRRRHARGPKSASSGRTPPTSTASKLSRTRPRSPTKPACTGGDERSELLARSERPRAGYPGSQ